MTFGPFLDEHCFEIETSATYAAIQGGVKMAEFLLLRFGENKPPCVWIVEAKQSAPRHTSAEDFKDYIREIRDKLLNGLGMGIAAILKRHPAAQNELPLPFRNLDLSIAGFRLILVVNGHKKDWLPPLQDALQKALHVTIKTFALGPLSVVVMNHEVAKSKGLISSP